MTFSPSRRASALLLAAGTVLAACSGPSGEPWSPKPNAFGRFHWPSSDGRIAGMGGGSRVAGGDGTAYLVGLDGALWAWGSAPGIDGALVGSATPVRIGTGFAYVAAGGSRAAALQPDGTLWAWPGFIRNYLDAQPITEARFAMVAVNATQTVALRDDASLWSWGDFEPPAVLATGIASVAASGESIFAITMGGELRAWTPGVAAGTTLGSGFATVAAGSGYFLANRSDGTLWSWGDNARGQLGDGTTAYRSTPVQVGAGFDAVSTRDGSTLAVKADGALWAWGGNEAGQLGDGTTRSSSTPRQVGAGFAAVAAGPLHSFAVKADGTLWAWGNGVAQAKQLGTGFTSVLAPVSAFPAALGADGTLWTWRYDSDGPPVQIASRVASYAPSERSPLVTRDGTLWFTMPSASGAWEKWGTGFASVAAGWGHVLALQRDGTLWAWGRGYQGQLGTGSGAAATALTEVAIQSDGTLWAWGENSLGQVGNGAVYREAAPRQVLLP